MKKLLKLFLLGSMVVGASACKPKESSSVNTNTNQTVENTVSQFAYDIPENPTVYIHYYNFEESYNSWLTWIWPHEPVSTGGAKFYFQKFEEIAGKTWGTIAIDTTNPMDDVLTSWDDTTTKGTIEFGSEVTTLGIIIRNEAGAKEYEADRYLDLTQKSDDGATHLYVIEGSANMWYDVNEVDYNKVSSASFKNVNTVEVEAFQPFKKDTEFKVKLEDQELPITDVKLSSDMKVATLTLKDPFDLTQLGKSCTVEAVDYGKRDISFENLYESEEFVKQYTTDEELGAIYTTEKTTFKVWAPTATEVKLNIYTQGNEVEAYDSLALTKQTKGVWSTEVLGDLDGKYYTYDVTVAGVTNKDIVDPYAQSTGVNGKRGMILNMAALNPAGWDSVTTPTVEASNDAIVYELHTRDLTSDATWNGSEENRGKFLGLIEEGTTYNGQPTGFDYIKSLGVTHVQLLPIYDFQSVDETQLDSEDYKQKPYGGIFNWGYDPQNYNSPEGSYSSDPYDGATRVRELKRVSQAYNNAGMGIIMDVVFNHMPSAQNSSFDKIVPGYYFRGRNDSGAGSDTASERVMFRKFMADVTETWIKEYKLSGYRFDLMGLHDVDTMNTVSDRVNAALKEINPDSKAIIYGEGWNMYKGGKNTKMATQTNVKELHDVGAFNDTFRDAVKGQGDNNERGWALANTGKASNIKLTLAYSYSTTYAGNSINYVEAHDNMTLWDKLQLSGEGIYNNEQLRKADVLAAGLVLTSQGTSFIHAGQEMLRTKQIDPNEECSEKVTNSEGTIAFNRNSYNSSDKVNSIKWNLTVENAEIVDAYKEMIKMRKEQNIFHYPTLNGIDANVTVSDNKKMITLDLASTFSTDWTNVKVVYNNDVLDYNLTMDGSEFNVGFANNTYTKVGETVTTLKVPSGTFAVIYY